MKAFDLQNEIQSNIEENTLMPNELQEADLRRRGRRKKICIVVAVVVGILVVLAILFTVLALTVFKAKNPVTTINTVSLQDFNAALDITKLKILINLTLFIELSINNPNKVGFKYQESVAYLRYKDEEIGEAPIEEGEIGKKETKPMNLTLTLMADKVLFDPEVYSQIKSLPLSTYVELKGKIQLLFKINVKSYSTCDFNIDVGSGALSNTSCHYKTKV